MSVAPGAHRICHSWAQLGLPSRRPAQVLGAFRLSLPLQIVIIDRSLTLLGVTHGTLGISRPSLASLVARRSGTGIERLQIGELLFDILGD